MYKSASSQHFAKTFGCIGCSYYPGHIGIVISQIDAQPTRNSSLHVTGGSCFTIAVCDCKYDILRNVKVCLGWIASGVTGQPYVSHITTV